MSGNRVVDAVFGRIVTEALTISHSEPAVTATNHLRQNAKQLRARSGGAAEDTIEQAGFYARKHGKPFFVYQGNSYGHAIWRATYRRGDALDPVNNTGLVVLEVAPDLQVTRHTLKR